MKKTILLVDDEESILLGIGKQLQNLHYEVSTAPSGEDAIRKLETVKYDLVITDLMMENVSGIDVLKTAKRIDPLVMVIVLTGHGSLNTAIEALRFNADDYILKPCERSELEFRVKKCMEAIDQRKKLIQLHKFLPLCAMCDKVCDSFSSEPFKGEWIPMDTFLEKKASSSSYMSYCPECTEKTQKDIESFQNRD
jgi:DNA-binding response OmpR family regulator